MSEIGHLLQHWSLWSIRSHNHLKCKTVFFLSLNKKRHMFITILMWCAWIQAIFFFRGKLSMHNFYSLNIVKIWIPRISCDCCWSTLKVIVSTTRYPFYCDIILDGHCFIQNFIPYTCHNFHTFTKIPCISHYIAIIFQINIFFLI